MPVIVLDFTKLAQLCSCVCFVMLWRVCEGLCAPSDEDMTSTIKEMETMILECAKLDREINYFVDIVQQVTSEVNATDHIMFRS